MASTSLEKHDSPGAIHPAGAGHAEVVTYNPDAPSEEWGWHGHWSDFAPRGRFLLLGLGVFGILVMLIGNHQSNVENWFLIIIGALMIAWMVRSETHRRKAKRLKP